ncbi:hypothetical protein [Collimonas arenae]|uniref:hypothetical protein n=1 Tax=Collimonas arenae TaxID=279058 RepID=UPI0005704CF5|nr:hypothetical protein [Collimonas arenae]
MSKDKAAFFKIFLGILLCPLAPAFVVCVYIGGVHFFSVFTSLLWVFLLVIIESYKLTLAFAVPVVIILGLARKFTFRPLLLASIVCAIIYSIARNFPLQNNYDLLMEQILIFTPLGLSAGVVLGYIACPSDK